MTRGRKHRRASRSSQATSSSARTSTPTTPSRASGWSVHRGPGPGPPNGDGGDPCRDQERHADRNSMTGSRSDIGCGSRRTLAGVEGVVIDEARRSRLVRRDARRGASVEIERDLLDRSRIEPRINPVATVHRPAPCPQKPSRSRASATLAADAAPRRPGRRRSGAEGIRAAWRARGSRSRPRCRS